MFELIIKWIGKWYEVKKIVFIVLIKYFGYFFYGDLIMYK